MHFESYGRSMFFGSSGQFLGTNETRNDIYHRIEVLRDHMYLYMLLFSLCTPVFDSRLLFTSVSFRALHFALKKSSAKVKKSQNCNALRKIVEVILLNFRSNLGHMDKLEVI